MQKRSLVKNFVKNLVKKGHFTARSFTYQFFLKNVILSMICLRQKISFLEYIKEEINFDM